MFLFPALHRATSWVLRLLKGRNHSTYLKKAYSLIEDFVKIAHNQDSLIYLWGRKGAAFSEVIIKGDGFGSKRLVDEGQLPIWFSLKTQRQKLIT